MFYKSGGHRYTWKSAYQHIILLIAYVNCPENIFLIDVSFKDGTASYLHILITHVLFGMPLLYLELFIGKFSRMGCLCFGRMMPITIGIGYTMLLVAVYQLISYGSLMTTITKYLVYSLSTEIPWTICKDLWPSSCMDIQRSTIKNCTNKTTLSSELYFRQQFVLHELPDEPISSLGKFDVIPCVCLVIIWFITFLYCFRTQDFNLSMRWSVVAEIIAHMNLIVLIYITARKFYFIDFYNQFKSLLNTSAWADAIYIVSRSTGVHYGVNILFGSYMKLEQSVDNIAIVQDILVFLLSIQHTMLISSCCRLIKEKTDCDLFSTELWQSNKKRLLFVVVPFALGYLGLPQMCTFVYCLFLSVSTMNCLITRICFTYCCLADEYSQAQFYRSYILGFLCLICFAAGIPTITNQGFAVLEIVFFYVGYKNAIVVLLTTTLTVCHLYGVERLFVDIHFMAGNKPALFWKICWYLSFGITVLFGAFFWIKHSTVEKKYKSTYENVLEGVRYIVQFVIYFPILCGICFEIFRKLKQHNLPALFIPNEYWGPPNREERKNRKLFNPKTETRSTRLVDSCDHNCLHNSAVLERIIELETKMRRKHLNLDGEPILLGKSDYLQSKSISFGNF